MPKIYLSENEKMCARLASWVYGELKVKGLSHRAMARELNISQQALSQKLKAQSFSYTDFITFIRVLEPDDGELNRLLGRR